MIQLQPALWLSALAECLPLKSCKSRSLVMCPISCNRPFDQAAAPMPLSECPLGRTDCERCVRKKVDEDLRPLLPTPPTRIFGVAWLQKRPYNGEHFCLQPAADHRKSQCA
jgi:hypothetical protein